jgi:hypothetical protein
MPPLRGQGVLLSSLERSNDFDICRAIFLATRAFGAVPAFKTLNDVVRWRAHGMRHGIIKQR